jgi:hypothetical protein|tara:strand:+ start:24 stop:449 length:426 start_codon:yes stop_codon:yes gene_type:complete
MSTLPDQSENVPSAPTSEEVAPRSSSAASPSPATPATKTIVSTEKDVSVDAAGADEYKLEQTKTKTQQEQLSGEEWLAAQTRKVFDGVAALASSELKATSDEFQLLEQVNRVASAKYAELSDSVESLESVSKELIEQRTSS